MKLKLITSCCLLGLSLPLYAENLLETYLAAQKHDASFASANASYQAAQEKLPQSKALLRPNINLNANYNQVNSDIQYGNASNLPSNNNHYNSQSYSLNLVQPIYRTQNWQAYSIAELQLEQSQAQLKQAQQELILRVTQAYLDVLMAEDNLQLTQAQKQAISEQLAQAKKNFEVGSATITDTHEAQARFDLISAQEISNQNQLELKQQALAQLTGSLPNKLKRLRQPPELEMPQPTSLAHWQQQATEHSFQNQIARLNVALAKKNIKREHGGHHPTLDLIASYSNNSNTTGLNNDSKQTSVGLQFNLPLYQGGATQSKIREAEALHERSLHDQTHSERTLQQQTRQAYLGVVNGIAQINALQQALLSSESALRSSQTGQQAGVRTNVDVLNAQQQVFSTRRDLYQSQYNYLISKMQLQAAVGQLNEASLQQINQGLEN